MKVVINKCFGGFGLSRKGIKRWAELNGRECYFFSGIGYGPDDEKTMFFSAFDIPNPSEVIPSMENWHEMSKQERDEANDLQKKHAFYDRNIDRTDPKLIQVVEELGDEASGSCAKLAIVEIPDGVEYEIAEYDGSEHIAEVHRTWY